MKRHPIKENKDVTIKISMKIDGDTWCDKFYYLINQLMALASDGGSLNWTDTIISIKLMVEHMSVRALLVNYHQSVKWV